MNVSDGDLRRAQEVHEELQRQDCSPEQVTRFIRFLGLPSHEVMRRGGPLFILASYVPGLFPSYAELVRSIKELKPSS